MNCDKCGYPVEPKNDATLIEAAAFGNTMLALFAGPRHFLPTEHCEGSPSRAQYIQGQPLDTRGYEYQPQDEAAWRDGFAKIQAEFENYGESDNG